MLIGTGSCGTRTKDCFHPQWQCWRLLCWVEGWWWCQCCPGCCRVLLRGGLSPLAVAPPGPAAAPTAVASGAAGAGRLKAPMSLFAPLLHAAHLTAETTTLQETEQTQASLFLYKSGFLQATLSIPVRRERREGKRIK